MITPSLWRPLYYGSMESSDCCPAFVRCSAPRQCEPSMDTLSSELIFQPLCRATPPWNTLQGNCRDFIGAFSCSLAENAQLRQPHSQSFYNHAS